METVTRFAERQAGSVSAVVDAWPRGGAHALRDRELPAVGGRQEGVPAGGRRRPRRSADPAAGSGQPAAPGVGGQARRRAAEAAGRDSRGTANERVVRIDAAPVYDAPPTIEDLYRAAAKNHELERAYYAERVAAAIEAAAMTERELRESDRRRRFLADKEQRAVAHPPPSPKQLLRRDGARSPAVRRVNRPGTARRMSARGAPAVPRGLAREGRTQSSRPRGAARAPRGEEAVHRRVGRCNGTEEQKARQAAGVLPMAEAIEGITDQAFAVTGRPAAIHARRRGAAADDAFVNPGVCVDTVVGSAGRDGSQQQRREGDSRAVGGCSGVPEADAGRDVSLFASTCFRRSKTSRVAAVDGVRRAGDQEARTLRAAA